jgi:glucose-6-phosphate 1-dehydrogenase
MIDRLVIFGATGDLTARYLLPALAELHEAGALPEGLEVVGAARQAWEIEDFRARAEGALAEHASEVAPEAREAVVSMLRYRRTDVTSADDVAAVAGERAGPLVAYLALPPSLYGPALEALAAASLPEGSRVVVEKPFGEDLRSARRLNRLLHRCFPEEAIYRIDHFLHLRTVQNLLAVRLANRVLEPLWHRDHVERVDVVWDETLTLEGRASYYDATGALRDMVQNHLLQILCLVAMEPPPSLAEGDLRDRKMDVLRAVRSPTREEAAQRTTRARYLAGRIGDRAVPDYTAEEGVDPSSETETFARAVLEVGNERWSGVPFVLRTGKALAEDRHEVVVRFRTPPPLDLAQGPAPDPNVLRFDLDEDRIDLELNVTAPGEPFDLKRTALTASMAPQDLPAYGRLLLDVLHGDVTLSIRDDEAEEAWRIVEPILGAWADGVVPLEGYPAGSHGPPTS